MATLAFRDLRTGIDRTRRFAAQSADRLYDLVNAQVNDSGRIVKRPGFTSQAIPAACRGLFGWRGKLHTFVATPQANPNPALYVINVLRHPTGGAAALAKIHNVVLAQGALYVAAEFADGVLKHYWLDPPTTWAANLATSIGDFIAPTAPAGFQYQVQRNTAIKVWKPDTVYALNATVQPSTANGRYYQVTARQGTNPQSGSFEPSWPTVTGQVITEVHMASVPPFVPGGTDTTGDTDPDDPPDRPGPLTRNRYLVR